VYSIYFYRDHLCSERTKMHIDNYRFKHRFGVDKDDTIFSMYKSKVQ